jgi:hypothetical protein
MAIATIEPDHVGMCVLLHFDLVCNEVEVHSDDRIRAQFNELFDRLHIRVSRAERGSQAAPGSCRLELLWIQSLDDCLLDQTQMETPIQRALKTEPDFDVAGVECHIRYHSRLRNHCDEFASFRDGDGLPSSEKTLAFLLIGDE